MKIELMQNIMRLKGEKLVRINLVCQMIILDFGKDGIHCQALTRIIKNNEILFTTYDYQSWDQKEDTNNDEWYFFEKYKEDIINGTVIDVIISDTNDLTLVFDNGVRIEVYIVNGYNHYSEEQEQWCLLIDAGKEYSKHYVIYNKNIEFYDLQKN